MEDYGGNLTKAAVENDGGLDDLKLIINGERFHNNAGTENEAEEIITCLEEMYGGISFFIKKFSVHFGPIDLPKAGNHQWKRAKGYSIWYSPPFTSID